ncbi:MAG TPA: hypothetical protein PK691_07595, partial [Thermomicrobiales bacterium]|nr:hypothetical protein [Thermomicrobiales bacterium]
MSRLLAVLTLLAMLLSPLAQVPHMARAQNGGIDGTTYTDDAYGFVVEWPKNTYEASVQEYEDGTPYGLRLGFDGGFGLVGGLAHDDAEACLDAPTEVIRDLDGVTKFRETSQYDTEGLTRDLESRFVTYTYQPEGQLKASTHANFFGCEPMMQGGELVDGVFLYFEFGDTTADFEDNFTAFIDIMNGVTFGGDSGTNNDDSGDLGQVRDDTDDADATDDTSDNSGSTDDTDAESTDRDANGIADTSYVDPTYGFGVSYAADADPEVAEDTDGNQIGVVFGSDFATFVRWWSGSPARTCVNEYVSLFEGEAVDGEISEADDLDMPDSPDAERAILVRFDYVADADADPVSWLVYVECRQMVQDGEPVEDVFLSVTAVVVED